ncbi:gene transfer agent family protein [Jiella avicenniae]|uniref:Gene transfer agent family protein n=1 Tax=Jiella avicenniae TaxID=2907202 RepID=A0A9X1P188_9HYPH|nr:gene transfer agent family protein [Jiella avicenniae]MCE7029535.1 gene transfer agent family protein [Jiella avicenniae]
MTTHRAFFGDAHYDFALKAPQIAELQHLCGAGIGTLCQRIFRGDFAYSDLVETIRLALIGGGLDPQRAAELIEVYSEVTALERLAEIAIDVLGKRYFPPETGPEPEQTGELDAEALA